MQVPAVTTHLMWSVTGLLAAIDLAFAAVLSLRVRAPWSPRLAPALLTVGTLSFAVLFTWALRSYWDSCYAAALPSAMKSLAPLLGAVLGALGWVFWWLARRPGRGAVPLFLLLGALESIPGHLNAIHRFALLDRCPLIQGISPASALVFGMFEFGFYWSVVLTASNVVARLLDGSKTRSRGTKEPPATR